MPNASYSADIHVHPNGSYLYATNRPTDADGSIVVYQIDASGQLTFIQKISTQGRVPRNFAIVANNTRIVVGNQETKTIIAYAIKESDGTLEV